MKTHQRFGLVLFILSVVLGVTAEGPPELLLAFGISATIGVFMILVD